MMTKPRSGWPVYWMIGAVLAVGGCGEGGAGKVGPPSRDAEAAKPGPDTVAPAQSPAPAK